MLKVQGKSLLVSHRRGDEMMLATKINEKWRKSYMSSESSDGVRWEGGNKA